MINRWSNISLSRLFPPVCVLCGDPGVDGMDLCRPCRLDLPLQTHTCPHCGIALAAESVATAPCGSCQQRPPPYDRVLAPFRYASPLDHLIHRLKYHGRLEQARLLGDLMAHWLELQLDTLPDRVIPVPLHPARLRQRGFNQAVELARRVCHRLQLPLDTQSCHRQKATLPQSEMADARARARNIKGAFLVRGEIRGTVAILDDVMTTGSTVGELAKCLRAAGATRIEVWACARTHQ